MKKFLIFMCALFLAGNAFSQIGGSAHDFSGQGWSGGQICLPCHTPHNADTSVVLSPLWNHEMTAGGAYDLYTSGTLDATPDQPEGISKLCLSCHDGTVALDSFGGDTGLTFIDADANVGTDLSDDHPISFTYDTALATADGELHNPATDPSGLGGTIAVDMLFAGSLECASCHDVHNSNGFANLLLVDNAGSALCLTCHLK